eukprot:scaffold13239_cov69-Phaeocystis_antarctica.AAC.4
MVLEQLACPTSEEHLARCDVRGAGANVDSLARGRQTADRQRAEVIAQHEWRPKNCSPSPETSARTRRGGGGTKPQEGEGVSEPPSTNGVARLADRWAGALQDRGQARRGLVYEALRVFVRRRPGPGARACRRGRARDERRHQDDEGVHGQGAQPRLQPDEEQRAAPARPPAADLSCEARLGHRQGAGARADQAAAGSVRGPALREAAVGPRGARAGRAAAHRAGRHPAGRRVLAHVQTATVGRALSVHAHAGARDAARRGPGGGDERRVGRRPDGGGVRGRGARGRCDGPCARDRRGTFGPVVRFTPCLGRDPERQSAPRSPPHTVDLVTTVDRCTCQQHSTSDTVCRVCTRSFLLAENLVQCNYDQHAAPLRRRECGPCPRLSVRSCWQRADRLLYLEAADGLKCLEVGVYAGAVDVSQDLAQAGQQLRKRGPLGRGCLPAAAKE